MTREEKLIGWMPKIERKLETYQSLYPDDKELRKIREILAEFEASGQKGEFGVVADPKLFKFYGSTDCKSCETGRVTLFIANDECMSCNPKSYERSNPPTPADEATAMEKVFNTHYQYRYKGQVDRFDIFVLGWKAALKWKGGV